MTYLRTYDQKWFLELPWLRYAKPAVKKTNTSVRFFSKLKYFQLAQRSSSTGFFQSPSVPKVQFFPISLSFENFKFIDYSNIKIVILFFKFFKIFQISSRFFKISKIFQSFQDFSNFQDLSKFSRPFEFFKIFHKFKDFFFNSKYINLNF